MSRQLLLLLLVFASTPLVLARQAADRPQPQSPPEAEQRIRALQHEADRLAGEARTLLGELRRLEIDRDIQSLAVKKADAELSRVTQALARAAARVTALEAARVASSAGVRERLVEIYKRGSGGYVRLLLAADDLRALGRLSRAVAAVARIDRVRIEEHRRAIAAERAAVAELEEQRRSAATVQAEARKARAALDTAVAAHNRRIDEIDQRRDLAAQYVGELQAAAATLAQRVDNLPSTPGPSMPLARLRGSLDWPVSGRIVSSFGAGVARSGVAVVRNGIEIAATPGTEVRAVHGGAVTFAGPFIGFGTLVILDHGSNDFTVYGYLEQSTVSEGARVERGSVVGRAGRNPDGADVVYFEVRVDGRPVDPLQWFTRR